MYLIAYMEYKAWCNRHGWPDDQRVSYKSFLDTGRRNSRLLTPGYWTV